MCGRFGLNYPQATLRDWYQTSARPEIGPQYNIVPTMDIVVIRDDESGRHWINDLYPLPSKESAIQTI
ncbi:MAG: SOS response-associated peptidase family protein [Nitrosospira sp.]